MAEILISTTALILIVLMLRRVTLGRISMSMRYALWLIVAVRLVMPISIGSSPLSVMNPVGNVSAYLEDIIASGAAGYEEGDRFQNMAGAAAGESDGFQNMAGAAVGESDGFQNIAGAASGGTDEAGNMVEAKLIKTDGDNKAAEAIKTNGSKDKGQKRVFFHHIAIMIWIAGMVFIGGYIMVGQVRFVRYLSRTREVVGMDRLSGLWVDRLEKHKLRVYMVNRLPSPCMMGRSIYISTELWDDENKLLHVLAHEYAHAVQRDAVWAMVRSVLCAVYWFHPLVWVAAYEARQDSELAGDERAIRMLGESKRFAYGNTLLGLLSDGNDRIGCAGVVLTMSGSGKKMKERVSMIAGKKKKSVVAAGFAGLVMILACGCSFTGAKSAENEMTEESRRTETYAEAGTEAEEKDVSEEAAKLAEVTASEQAEKEVLLEKEALLKLYNEIEGQELQIQQELYTIESEKAQIQQKFEEIEAERLWLKVEEEAREETAEPDKQSENVMFQNLLDEIAIQKLAIQQELDTIEAYKTQVQQKLAEIETQKLLIQKQIDETEALKFENMLYSMDDTALASATTIDKTEYYDYLYNALECPMEDGGWYLIHRDETYGIDFYGLFTLEYGCRGVKILIDGDVNTFDLSWMSAATQSETEVVMLEQAPDGTPRTFAFKMCVQNTGKSEVWKLYIADRYDTGTIELYTFTEEACREQFRNVTGFTIDEEEKKVYVTYEGDVVVGAIDISAYGDYEVEEVVWDGSVMGYNFDEDAGGGENELPITFWTGIGLKLAGESDIQTSGLSLIGCPVTENGTFGSRRCMLGAPTVDQQYVNGSLRTVP